MILLAMGIAVEMRPPQMLVKNWNILVTGIEPGAGTTELAIKHFRRI